MRAELFGSLGATGNGHGSHKAVHARARGRRRRRRSTPTSVAERLDADPRGRPAAPARPPRDRLRREGPSGAAPAQVAAASSQRHALHRIRRAGGDAACGRLLLGRRRLRGRRGRRSAKTASSPTTTALPYPFTTGAELLRLCREHELSISDLMLANEQAWRDEAEIRAGLLEIWQVMQDCVRARLRRGRGAAGRAQGQAPGRRALPSAASPPRPRTIRST